jgi:hypothetical protein
MATKSEQALLAHFLLFGNFTILRRILKFEAFIGSGERCGIDKQNHCRAGAGNGA